MLSRIIAHKRMEVQRLDEASLRRQAEQSPWPRDFLAVLTPSPNPSPSPALFAREWGRGGPAGDGEGVRAPRLIAELKRASPSRGVLAPHLDMLEVAELYAANGAAAVSVLTDEEFFRGSLDTLRELRAGRSCPLPLLRKDFIIHPAQVYETRAAGADAVLLIVAALEDDCLLADLHALALELGLMPLVEVHDETDLDRALALAGLRLAGINNRDLNTFQVSLETTARLRPRIPPEVAVVSESGIFTREHVVGLSGLGVHAVLVGEALVTAADIGAKVRELAAW
jgi:indole-3-glycerol phosphate synthase